MDDPKQLRDFARWYAAASQTKSDPQARVDMARHAHELVRMADTLARSQRARVAVNTAGR